MGGLARRARLALLACLMAQLAVGCPHATIHLKNGDALRGEIRYSDAETVYTTRGAVPRSEIERIRHPGLGWGIAGTIFTAGLIVPLIFVASTRGSGDDCDEGEDSLGICSFLRTMAVLAGIGAAISAGIMIWGWKTFVDSRARARAPDEDELTVAPIALTDGERVYWSTLR